VAWALDEVRRRHPRARVVFIGHSMGGRTALRCAGDPSVVGVCALAPWIEPGEPSAHLAGRTVLIAHSDRDRITDPEMSREFAEQVALAGAEVRFDPSPVRTTARFATPAAGRPSSEGLWPTSPERGHTTSARRVRGLWCCLRAQVSRRRWRRRWSVFRMVRT
jgi:pimeloyl-ACP methyl ester carboxylesterase